MKKKLSAFVVLSFFPIVVWAQGAALEDTVTFTKPVPAKVVSEKKTENLENEVVKIPQVDAKKMLAETTKNLSIMDNPRFVKKAYAGLKGRQKSIERLQQKKLEESSYPNEKAKKEALKELEDKALVHFEDYQDERDVVKNKVNDNPRESVLDMASRLSYSEKTDDEAIARSRSIQKQLNQKFLDEKGITPDEYMNAYNEEVRLKLQQDLDEQNKAAEFPILNTEKDVKVEKIDEQNALLHVSVGAPRSKKE